MTIIDLVNPSKTPSSCQLYTGGVIMGKCSLEAKMVFMIMLSTLVVIHLILSFRGCLIFISSFGLEELEEREGRLKSWGEPLDIVCILCALSYFVVFIVVAFIFVMITVFVMSIFDVDREIDVRSVRT